VAFQRPARAALVRPLEAAMEPYIHNANIQHYRRLIVESERNPKRDEDRHKMLLTLLAEEIAKEKKTHD
jgi:stress-induced morphogen